MDRVKNLWKRRDSYEPLDGGSERPDGSRIVEEWEGNKARFFWTEYGIFFLLGIAMLWAWNMFLAAGPYFQHRFRSSESLQHNFQSAELAVSTIMNLGSMLVLTKLQANASYPRRIMTALVLNMLTFTLLAISTRVFGAVSASGYFGFMIVMVAVASLATGLLQNGIFAYVTGFGREEYTQAIMTGQAVAGVLPCIAQIASVLSVPEAHDKGESPQESSTSAFSYFLTATVISAITFVAFLYLITRHGAMVRRRQSAVTQDGSVEDPTDASAKTVPLMRLFRKLFWLASAVFLTFAVTMVYPVFTQATHSVQSPADRARIFEPASFIPLALLVWNLGDLFGRLATAIPKLSLTSRPRLVFILAVSRFVFVPLYLLCNVPGGPAKIKSDTFYLLVQLLFGLSNGFLGSTCMMGASEWVDVDEREAAGGFMGLCLVAGLTVGSLCSFFVAKAW